MDQSARLFFAAFDASQSVWWTLIRHVLDIPFQVANGAREDLGRMSGNDRHTGVAVNVGFGTITFGRDEEGDFVEANVEITRRERPADSLMMTLRVAGSVREPIVDIVERSRLQVLDMLKGATERLERETAEALIFACD